MSRTIRIEPAGVLPAADLRALAEGARRGLLLAFPTDTVYGLGTSALVPEASRRIYAVKGRDPGKPLPILVHSAEEARRWVRWTPTAQALSDRYWPGPLTLVLEAREEARPFSSADGTLAVRVPAHPTALALLEASGLPWASTSANRSGEPELADGAAVAAEFGEAVDFVVDAGPCAGRASTVVDARAAPRVLREGALARHLFR